MRAYEKIAQVLDEAGIDHVFGIPGGGTMAIYEQLYDYRDRIKTVLAHHEHSASIMADAYGRATGRPAVVMGQGVFIGSNAAFGIMEAFMSSSPMVIITDTSDGEFSLHGNNQSGAGEYGTVDLLSIFRGMTKYTALATSPKEAVIGVQQAIKHAISGRPGPACVVMRSRAIAGEVNEEAPPFIQSTKGHLNVSKPALRQDDLKKVADMLVQARNPVIVAGHGVHLSGAHQELRALAELLSVPVVTTYKGKSALAETHPMSLGMAGVYGQPAANAYVGQADLVIVVGARMAPADTVRERPNVFNAARQKFVQIDVEPRNIGWVFPVEVGMVGDAKEALQLLLDAARHLAPARDTVFKQRAEDLQKRKTQPSGFYNHPSLLTDSAPIYPQRLVRLLQENLDPRSLIALDAGNNRVWMCEFYQSQQANTFFCPGGTAGMGWAMPAALSLKMVHPDRPVVAVTGDGGFMMSTPALYTAMQHEIPVTIVVMNDSSLGMVRHHQGNRLVASTFRSTDYGAVARGMGGFGVQVSEPKDVREAIRAAQASGKLAVVDVVIDKMQSTDNFRADRRGVTET
jgi:acetolactate synthase-1/2/3 large subunit